MQQQLLQTPRQKRCNIDDDAEEEGELVSQQETFKSEEPVHTSSNKNRQSLG